MRRREIRLVAQGLNAERVLSEVVDVSDLVSVDAFAKRALKNYNNIDVLLLNAGCSPTTRQLSKQGHELQFATQHLGHFALTILLLVLLKKTPNSRVVVVSSDAHTWVKTQIDFDDVAKREKGFSSMTVYPESKLLNLLFARELQHRLSAAGASCPTVVTCNPGCTKSDLIRDVPIGSLVQSLMLAQSTSRGALDLVRAAVDPSLHPLDFISPVGGWTPFATGFRGRHDGLAKDDVAAGKLWTISEQMTGLKFPQ